ncbi:HAD-IC family P-type ATPase [Pseudonocardia sp. H11422]|uniref:HAD-IC family P-type ATPase n=1 Tax=Pseudonocardia sp. H11422 TaxID=2835866 RepID=UPI001BDC0331|nr:HAD-IC family P-type ATPase [Pseudonocardia sp. H11422]
MVLQRLLGATTRAAGAVFGASVGAVAGAFELVSTAVSGATYVAVGRAHIPVRGVHREDAGPVAAQLEQWLSEHDGVIRAEINAVLGQVVIAYDPDRLGVRELTGLVGEAEREFGLAGEPRAPAGRAHPGGPGAVLREALGVSLNLGGLGYATIARPLPMRTLGSVVPPLVGLVDATPRFRALAERALGRPAADLLLIVGGSVSQAVTRRPLGLIVDTCQRFNRHQESLARRRAWVTWDEELARVPGAHRAPPLRCPPRPCSMPGGPVERVADRSALVALCGYTALLAAIRSAPPATAALAAGVPKAAGAGREGFAGQLDRDAAARGTLVVDADVLRRLDRVDTVVVDARVLLSGRRVVDEVLPVAPGVDPAEIVELVHDLVDVRHPWRRRQRAQWTVEPLGRAIRTVPADIRAVALDHAASGAAVLALRYGEQVVALVTVSDGLDPLAEAVVDAARTAGSVLVSGATRRLERRLPVKGVVPGGDRTVASVRALQESGHVVALVAQRAGSALAAADVGIALTDAREAPPWGAHVLCRSRAEVCFLLEAVGPARQASRRSAQLSILGSAVGVLLAALGPRAGAPDRATVPVQMAALLALGLGTWSGLSAAGRPPPVPAERTRWHEMSPRAVLHALDSDPAGLADDDSRRRHEHVGRSGHRKVGLGRATLEELANPVTPTLAAGAGLSASAGSVLDPLLITTVLGLNAVIGGAQRLDAQRALRTLTRSSTTPVSVRRQGRQRAVLVGELVSGDVIRLRAGDAVPADCRLLDAEDVEIDESSLTGESVPVAKEVRATSAPAVADRRSMLYDGTVVAAGRADAVVVATGERTEAGRTLRLHSGDTPASGVEARLRSLTARALPVSVGAGIGLIAVDLLRRRPMSQAWSRAVSLAVAAVPEGLPFVATVAELAAARRLSARGALVRKPSTVEALGRVDTLCFDKTGTLTEGRISLRRVSDGVATHSVDDELPPHLREVLAGAVRASPFEAEVHEVAHQTDRAVLDGAQRLGIAADYEQDGVEHLDSLPFESSRGYHATLWRGGDGASVSVKGAPEIVLPLCAHWRGAGRSPLDGAARSRIEEEIDRLAGQGYRVLAVAQRRVPRLSRLAEPVLGRLEFHGLVALADRVRPTAADAVATLRAAGVEIVMITGDHPGTAESIAAELDALNGRRVLTGAELDALDDEQFAATSATVAVFARVTPAQKARIVQQLQQAGRTVAVTGDGTNDAPAIRLADVGLALGARATPAAREAADVVITDDRIETITDVIVEGRAMWTSVRDSLSILLGGNLGEIAYTLGTGLMSGGESLNARQLLLVNMLTDVLPAMAVAVRPPDVTPEELLAEGPDASLGSALTRDIGVRAAITAISAFVAWLLARPVSTPGQAGTTGLVALVGAQLGQTVVVRGRTPLVVVGAAGSFLVLAAAVQTPGVSRIVGSQPLLPHQWGLALAAALAAAAAQSLAQRLARRRSGSTGR